MKRQTQIKQNIPLRCGPLPVREAGLFYPNWTRPRIRGAGHGRPCPDRFRIFRKRILPPHGGPTTMTGSTPTNSKVSFQEVVDAPAVGPPAGSAVDEILLLSERWRGSRRMAGALVISVETEHYRYCLRCTSPGDYQGYPSATICAAADGQRQTGGTGDLRRWQPDELHRRAGISPVHPGRNCPQHPVTGFRYETLTDDPAVQNRWIDILFDLYGEENPHFSRTMGNQSSPRKREDGRNVNVGTSKNWLSFGNSFPQVRGSSSEK